MRQPIRVLRLGNIDPEPIEDVATTISVAQDDYHAVFCVTLIEAAIRKAPVTFVAGDRTAQPLADSLTQLWKRSVRHIAKAFMYGRAAFHLRFANDPANGITTIRKMDYVPPEHNGDPYSEMVIDPTTGAYRGIKLSTDKDKEVEATLTPEESWWFALDSTPLVPYGVSRLNGAVRVELNRRVGLLKLHTKFMQKHVLRGGVANVDRTVHDPITGDVIDNFALTEQMIRAYGSGAWAIMSNERDEKGNLRNTLKPDDTISDPEPLERSIMQSDVRLGRAFGIFDKLSTEGVQNGATEGSLNVHKEAFLSMIEDVVSQAVQSFNEHVIPKLVAKNGVSARSVVAVAPPLTEENKTLATDIVKAVVTNNTLSPLIKSGAINVVEMLRSVGLAVDGDAELKIETMLKEAREQKAAEASKGASGFRQIAPRGDGTDGGDPRDPNSAKNPELALRSKKPVRYVVPASAESTVSGGLRQVRRLNRTVNDKLKRLASRIVSGSLTDKEMKAIWSRLDALSSRKSTEGFEKGQHGYPNNARITWNLLGGSSMYKFLSKRFNPVTAE